MAPCRLSRKCFGPFGLTPTRNPRVTHRSHSLLPVFSTAVSQCVSWCVFLQTRLLGSWLMWYLGAAFQSHAFPHFQDLSRCLVLQYRVLVLWLHYQFSCLHTFSSADTVRGWLMSSPSVKNEWLRRNTHHHGRSTIRLAPLEWESLLSLSEWVNKVIIAGDLCWRVLVFKV